MLCSNQNMSKPTDPRKEIDPTGRDAHQAGAKLDAGKTMAGLLNDFSLALTAVAEVGTFGAVKYTRGGWKTVPNAIARYNDAGWRHKLKACTEAYDHDSGLLHKAHEAWNILAELELILRSAREASVTEQHL